MLAAFSYFLSLYIRSSMNIFSKEQKKRRISNSRLSRAIVWSADAASTSLTVRNCGFLSLMTQQLGEMLISQSVKAYRASSVLSEDTPGARCTRISTLEAVRSSTLRAFILPRLTAFVIESIRVSEVLEYGISRITSVFWSIFSILALTFMLPPRWPSL